MQPYAKVIADSCTRTGRRITTLELVLHRWVLAELNTHRVLVKSSASSRAIPVERQLEMIGDDDARPVSWPAEQPGMQGGAELTGQALAEAQEFYDICRNAAVMATANYLAEHPDKATRLHKSVTNRLIEPYMQHKVVMTGTAWQNFFGLRVHPDAQPEIRVAAELAKEAYDRSSPVLLEPGEWHLPYIDDEDRAVAPDVASLVRGSVSRAARTSSFQHGAPGEPVVKDLAKDQSLYAKLVSAEPMHAAPLEHVATPDLQNEHVVDIAGVGIDGNPYALSLTLPRYGSLLGFRAHRVEIEAAKGYQAFA
jgi:hypothetical protein